LRPSRQPHCRAIRQGPACVYSAAPGGSLHLRMGARRLLDCRQEAHTAPTPEIVPPPPANVESIPDAIPRREPRSAHGNPPFYKVLGRRYVVLATADGYLERGVASWYGPTFHGESTSSGEKYDMYGMTRPTRHCHCLHTRA